MCGIAGYIADRGHRCIQDALRLLVHRGPDAEEVFQADIDTTRELCMGHRRLSIIDLSAEANQPFRSNDQRYTIVFNGEIYNYKTLRQELLAVGRTFRTVSDTEVLLEAYAAWGADCLDRLDGMFALAIYDHQRETLFLARDQFGIKPLYFAHSEARRELLFASEIRAVAGLRQERVRPNPALFGDFLLNGWLYEPDTGYQDISKLGPGEYALFDCKNGKLTHRIYDDPCKQSTARPLSELIVESVALQSVADVRVGMFFSGGLDSTVVAAAYPAALSGLFMDYADDPSDVGIDQRYAQEIADRLNFPLLRETGSTGSADPDTIIDEFRQVATGTEEPISDFTFLASRQLSARARAHGFKVMLSGMGGDEIFAGYPRMQLSRKYGALRSLAPLANPLMGFLGRQSRFAKRANRLGGFLKATSFGEAYTRLVGYFSFDEVEHLLGPGATSSYLDRMETRLAPVSHMSHLKQSIYLDRIGFLAHNLTVTDRASMAESLEARVPLLTPKLAAWAFSQPDDALITARETKRPLRAFARSRLDARLVDRPKQGFNPPLDHRINQLGADRILSELRNSRAFDVIDPLPIGAWVTSHFSGRTNETFRLWQLLYFAFWLERAREAPAA